MSVPRRSALALAALALAAGTALVAPAGAASASESHTRAPLAALGDSYSSGEGAPPYEPASGTCDRSPLAWPRQVGVELGRPVDLLACSGAMTADVLHGSATQPNQIAALVALRPRPRAVTITIGGNDVGFGPVLGTCVLADCVSAVHDSERLAVTVLPGQLAATYAAIHAAVPRARLVVVGYPSLVPGSDAEVTGCPWLSTDERAAITRGGIVLDAVVALEAWRAHATYVDVRRAFRGHELCSKDPWLVPIGFAGAPPSAYAHPTPAGQAAIAAEVSAALGD
jgi:lysophospholipase L1-like esterase